MQLIITDYRLKIEYTKIMSHINLNYKKVTIKVTVKFAIIVKKYNYVIRKKK